MTLKTGFYRLQNGQYFKEKIIVDTNDVNDVTSTRQSVITRVVMIFMTRRYPLNNSEVV